MSPVAFEALSTLVDGYVAIEDRWAFDAVRRLATPSGADARVAAGASGAAGLGGLLAVLGDRAADRSEGPARAWTAIAGF